jgi:hypothetical protein
VATSLNNPDRWGASWPPVGRKDGHQWGEKVATDGEISMAIDTTSGSSFSRLVSRHDVNE